MAASKGQLRKLLILSIGVLFVLVGVLYQVRQNSPTQTQKPHSQSISDVLTASLQQQRRYFQRCWLKSNSLSNEPSQELTWQIFLKIEPSGRVKEFNLLNKSLFDPETEKCLRQISYRLKFPSFEGDEISITVPVVISNTSENR